MKKLELSILFFIIIASSIAATYTGTKPSDLNLSTPIEGNTKMGEFNNSEREIKTVIVNLENITTVTGTYTVAGTQTGILGSSTTGFTISFPAASTLATGTITKRFMIKNINSGTITLNLTVDGVGSPTVTGSQTFKLFTNGTSWFEDRVGRAAVASNADLLDDLDSTYFTNASNLATGTVNLNRIPGTLTGKSADLLAGQTGSYYTNASNLDSGTIPLARIPTTLTGKDADTVDNINGASIVQISRTISTTAPLAGGGDLSANLTLSMPLATSGQNGYISSADWSTFNNKLSTSRTITTTSPLTIAGVSSADLSADRTIAIATATASQDGFVKKEDFQIFTNKANITAGSGITSSSSTGTTTITNNGVLQVLAGPGISITGNGTGTPTISASGTSSAGGWTDTGTQTIGVAGNQVLPHGTVTIDAAYGITGLTDAWIPNNITLDNLTQITTRNYDDITGTSTIKPTQIAMGTTTYQGALNAVGSATFSGTVTAFNFSGSGAGLTGIAIAFSAITGVPTDNKYFREISGTATIPIRDSNGNLHLTGNIVGSETVTNLNPTRINFAGTTTSITGTQTIPVWYTLKETKVSTSEIHDNQNVLLYIPADAGGSSTIFVDKSSYQETLTTGGNAVSSSAYSKFGGASYYGTNGNLAVGTSTTGRYNIFGTDTCYISCFVKLDNLNATQQIFAIGETRFGWWFGSVLGIGIRIDGANTVFQGDNTGWSAGTEYHVALRKFAGGGYQLLRNGAVVASGTNSTSWDLGGNPRVGNGADSPVQGNIDDFYWEKNTNGTSTVPTTANAGTVTIYYNAYSSYYIPANSNTPFLTIIDDGTQSVKPQIIIGSTTSSATTTTGIKLEIVGGKARADQFISPSEEKKKVVYAEETKTNYLDELKNLRVDKWSWKKENINSLDAELLAKKDYIQRKRQIWINANKVNYTSTVLEPGTGTVIRIDKEKMDKDYKTFIELEWASDSKQAELVNEVKNRLEAGENPEEHISPFAGDPTTPAIMQSNSKQELVLNDMIGWSIKVMQAQQKEIGSLTTALENLRVLNNLK